ncbi:B-box type zinc finger protein ncl-1-like [Oculina patagonica]
MACASSTTSSTRETTNYARLCRLLVDVGTQALKDTFDTIHTPANLHTVLAGNKSTLQSLRARKIINATQWGKLFPAMSTSVSSTKFDITLLMVLLRNICGFTAPITGWDDLPALADTSREADIARVKYFRNTVYAHAEHASVDDSTFNCYWQDIQNTLVRLGGANYKTAIEHLKSECMDPELEDHYKELLTQWKKDEDNVKDQLSEIGSGIKHVMKKLDDLQLTIKKEITFEGKWSTQRETTHRPVTCKEKYHENETVEYYCEECKACICLKCGQTSHDGHDKIEIQQAAEERKVQMSQVFEKVKTKIGLVETKIEKQTELMKRSQEQISSALTKLTETVEELIQVLREHEMAIKTELAQINEAQQRGHTAKLEEFQSFASELRMSVEYGEAIVQKGICSEILQAEQTVFGRCEELLKTQEITIFKPRRVNYLARKEIVNDIRRLVPGQLVAVHTDPSQSVAEGKGLEEAELGAEAYFTVTTRDSQGNLFYDHDQVTVKIFSPAGKDEKLNVEDCRDGTYTVRYKPNSVGLHDIAVEVNGKPLTGSPWGVLVTPHEFKPLYSFGSRGKGREEFDKPRSIAVSEKSGNIAIADCKNKRVQLFDPEWKYIRTIGDKGTGAERIGKPMSVAFTPSDDVIVLHREVPKAYRMSVFTEHGQFIKHTGELLIDPWRVSITNDGHMIVCDRGDKSVKVLSPDGTELLQSFSDPDCAESPWSAVHHQGMFFVSYGEIHRIRVFNEEGEFLYNVGCGQLCYPRGVAIDKFNNHLVVCDSHNTRLQVFTLDGKFVNSVNEGMEHPMSVAVTNNGHVLVCDLNKHCIHVYQ